MHEEHSSYLPSGPVSSVPFNSCKAAECGGSGSGSSNGAEKAGKAEGDAGPSCSSLSKDAGDGKSRFFDDSEESEEGEEEEGSDEEVMRLDQLIESPPGRHNLQLYLKDCHLTSNQDGSEAEEGDSSEMEEEEDTEEGEEDSEDEEEEMCLPGMDGKEEVCAEALLYLMPLHHRDVTRSAPAVCWMTT